MEGLLGIAIRTVVVPSRDYRAKQDGAKEPDVSCFCRYFELTGRGRLPQTVSLAPDEAGWLVHE
jgi:hypothetical protein